MKKPALVILAAGLAQRYGGLKQLEKIGPSGETLIDYSIYDAVKAGISKVVFVIRRSIKDEFIEKFAGKFSDRIRIDYVFQEINNIGDDIRYSTERVKPWGTAHAVLCASKKIKEPFIVLNADYHYGYEAIRVMANYLADNRTESQNCFIVGYSLDKTLPDDEPVLRGVCEEERGYLSEIIERRGIQRIDNEIIYIDDDGDYVPLTGEEVVSMNILGFNPCVFEYLETSFLDFLRENKDNPDAEYSIHKWINDMITCDMIRVKVVRCDTSCFGMTQESDKNVALQRIQSLIDRGNYPEDLWRGN